MQYIVIRASNATKDLDVVFRSTTWKECYDYIKDHTSVVIDRGGPMDDKTTFKHSDIFYYEVHTVASS